MEDEYVYNCIAVSFIVFILTSTICSYFSGLIAIGTFITILVIVVLLFVVIPIIFKYTPGLQKGLLYLSSVNLPVDFKRPEKLIPGSRNVYVQTMNDSINLGVWQILPRSLLSNVAASSSTEHYGKYLSNGNPVLIYMHGNSGNRGTGHRIDLYKMLQDNNYHVIAFDYRNYGDSGKGELSENATINDAWAVYNWTKEQVRGNSSIFFWGHSLGTGISSHLVQVLESKGEKVAGLILEAPFNNLREEIRAYPLAQIWRFLPWFDHFFTTPMYENGLQYESDEHLVHVTIPILILHAEDDMVIPIRLSKKLYDKIIKCRGEGASNVVFKSYPANRHYGHKYIVKDKELPSIIDKFVKSSAALLRS